MHWLKTKTEVNLWVFLAMLAALLLYGFDDAYSDYTNWSFDRCIAEQKPVCHLGDLSVRMTYR